MDISSIITQVNDPDFVSTDVERPNLEVKSNPENKVSSNNDASNMEHSNNRPIHGQGDTAAASDEVISPIVQDPAEKADTDEPTVDVVTVNEPSKPRPLRELLCCFCFNRRSSTRRRQQQQQQQQHHNHHHHHHHGQNGQTFSIDLLGPRDPDLGDKICAVIDLDETLVHSSFKFVDEPDFVIDVEIEGLVHQVYVLKRPYADEFLERMGQLYECVLFTASLAKYADPVSDRLDRWSTFKHRLFRESCVLHCDNFVKDLAQLGRPVDRCVIIDNSPASYMFNTENAIRVHTWVGDQADTELRDLLPYMERLAAAASVPEFLRDYPPLSQAHQLPATFAGPPADVVAAVSDRGDAENSSNVAADVANDVANDVAADVANDVAADVANDVANDVAADVANDVANDVAADVATDVAANVAADVANNVAANVAGTEGDAVQLQDIRPVVETSPNLLGLSSPDSSP
ncbi:hypothetical protein BOX15_Mlig013551g1 [Macrostomum lignano]|uniref:FCP1 homology domain-containing protein n=2 Tax=Macrostomum lignano TaxID=282301 RepID=A0A267FIX6_9PLAT|nr:hypothetical protein BOX15_Mlig013551g1 [Macrostomum lignano]